MYENINNKKTKKRGREKREHVWKESRITVT
jgi:hypothetical protein